MTRVGKLVEALRQFAMDCPCNLLDQRCKKCDDAYAAIDTPTQICAAVYLHERDAIDIKAALKRLDVSLMPMEVRSEARRLMTLIHGRLGNNGGVKGS